MATNSSNVQGPIVLGHITIPSSERSYCQCDHCGHKYHGNSSFDKLWPQDVITSGEFVVIQGKQYPTSKVITIREY